MGRVTARHLARSPGVDLVTVADLDADAAAEAAAAAGGGAGEGGGATVRPVAADVSDPSFADLLRGHDVCIASVAYRLNPLVVEACLAARCSYIDLGGLFHVARLTLQNHDRFAEAGLTGITCMGGSPGVTNLLAVVGARELDTVREIHVRLGASDPSLESVPLPVPYSLEALLDEFTVPAMVYREGGWHEVPPLDEPEEVDFPPPVGRRTAVSTLHSEVATLPLAFPDATEVSFKIAFEPGLVERFQLLASIGLASTDPIRVGDQTVRPRDVLAALGKRLPQPSGTEDHECLRVVLAGDREGHAATVIVDCLVEPSEALGVGAGGLDTGVPPSVVAQMIAAGEVRGPGMFAPEQAVDADSFFRRVAADGLTFSVRVEQE